MLMQGWLFIGVVAIAATGVAISTQTEAVRVYPNDDGVAIISGIIGFLAWGFWTYGALDVEVVTGGQTSEFVMPELALFGVAMAIIPGFIALTGPVNIVRRARKPTSQDV